MLWGKDLKLYLIITQRKTTHKPSCTVLSCYANRARNLSMNNELRESLRRPKGAFWNILLKWIDLPSKNNRKSFYHIKRIFEGLRFDESGSDPLQEISDLLSVPKHCIKVIPSKYSLNNYIKLYKREWWR